jgi:hypothetical protein
MIAVPPKPTDFRPGQRVRLRPDVQPDICDRSGYITVVGNWLTHVQLDNSGRIVVLQARRTATATQERRQRPTLLI